MTEMPPPPPPPAGMPFEPQPPKTGQGLAIASMVLGIASLVFGVTAIVGLILGIISLAKKSAGRGFAIAGIVCSVIGLVTGTALMVAILMPSLTHSRELAMRAKCSMNLNMLGKAVMMYQADNNDKYPADLDAMIQAGSLPPDAMKCPSAKEKGRACDYLYAPPPADAPLSTVIACDLAGNHKGVRNVLSASGTITNMREAEFQAALAKPENADFAAKLRQAEAPSGK